MLRQAIDLGAKLNHVEQVEPWKFLEDFHNFRMQAFHPWCHLALSSSSVSPNSQMATCMGRMPELVLMLETPTENWQHAAGWTNRPRDNGLWKVCFAHSNLSCAQSAIALYTCLYCVWFVNFDKKNPHEQKCSYMFSLSFCLVMYC